MNQALMDHLLKYSVKRGEFTLRSGKTSNWFIDAKQTTCSPEGMLLVAAGVGREAGAEPVIAIPVVDRGGTAAALCAGEGIDFVPLVTAIELGFQYEG